MKALSVRQPWAWLIVNGHKDIENRSWQTSYRGPLLIHAGLKVDREDIAWLRKQAKESGVDLPDVFPTGGIVGVVTLVDCVTEHPSEWFDGPVGWVLADPAEIEFVPITGRLGLFEVDLELEGPRDVDAGCRQAL